MDTSKLVSTTRMLIAAVSELKVKIESADRYFRVSDIENGGKEYRAVESTWSDMMEILNVGAYELEELEQSEKKE